jgi:hypothetical protein
LFSSTSLCSTSPLAPHGVHRFLLTIRHAAPFASGPALGDNDSEAAAELDGACQVWFTPFRRSTGLVAADVRNSILFANDGALLATGMRAMKTEHWRERERGYQVEVSEREEGQLWTSGDLDVCCSIRI